MSARELLDQNVDNAFFGGFPSLRPVQEAAIKPIIEGKHVVACSGTGSGKTEAALTPLVSKYWNDFEKSNATVILYVAPTKALVNDLARRLEGPIKDKLDLRLGIRHGDRDDLKGRKKFPHVLITTPESLDVLLYRHDPALMSVRALVIDEVHLLYNTQRGVHLSVLIERLRRVVDPAPLQLVALSATIADLEAVGRFFFGQGADMEILNFPAHRTIDAQVRPADFGSVVEKLSTGRKCKLLAFANRRKDCEDQAEAVSEQKHLEGAVFVHYSSLAPETRIDIEERFQVLETALCNATSTLELGIDIGDIDAVLLCGVPSRADSFLQRIGRGNRRSNKTVAVCFVGMDRGAPAPVTEALRYLVLVDAARKGNLAQCETFELYGAVAQQCLSIIGSRQEYVSVKSLSETFEKLRYVDSATVERILSELARTDYLTSHEFMKQYGPGEGLHKLFKQRRIYGNFPIEAHMVEVRSGTEILGEVPHFSLENIELEDYVRFAANQWKVTNITEEGLELLPAEPPPGVETKTFQYAGKGRGFETFLNEAMWGMIHAKEFPDELLEPQMRERMKQAREDAQILCEFNQIPQCPGDPGILYYTFAGRLVNEAVALITQQENYRVGDHWLQVRSPIDWKSIPTDPADYEPVFESMFHPSMDQSIFQQMLPADLQVREYVQEWLKDEAVPRVLKRLAESEPVEIPLEDWPFG
ncbi:DEAD/DEAH box helicase [Desulfomonile tiedjei]|uniref:Lhr-like helicase n=1 Tax=Desulfomonile tiedjei (strain ATCC 49306 / DSM 6799 / DCB-1) TaxID=706587 RepID=I4CF96_DESTA|nr:DEAD/DEAH box helicase [Desulfomonile tiedjei]AFM28237.1 Lhr-like helicase [Desulfomonile tiedjei DSM 6799]